MNLNEPVRDLSHLHPALRRKVEEPWRQRKEIGRKKKTPPRIEKKDDAVHNGQAIDR